MGPTSQTVEITVVIIFCVFCDVKSRILAKYIWCLWCWPYHAMVLSLCILLHVLKFFTLW